MDEAKGPGRHDGAPGARRRRAWVAALAAGGTTAALLVAGTVSGGSPAAAAALVPFGDCDELTTWTRDLLRPHVGPWGLDGGVSVALDGAGAAEARVGAVTEGSSAPTSADASTTGGAVGPGATGTNVQEAGVDEPDLVKVVDGLLVTTVGDELVLADVGSDLPRPLGRVGLPALEHGQVPWGPAASGPALPEPRPVEPGTAEPALPEPELPEPELPEPELPEPELPEPELPGPTEPGDGLQPREPGPAPEPLPEPLPPAGEPAPSAGSADLLVVGDRVVVLSTSWVPTGADPDQAGAGAAGILPFPLPGQVLTAVTVVDVADPASPQVVSTTHLEGGYVSARQSGGSVRLVTSSVPALPWVHPGAEVDGEALDEDDAQRRNRAVLDDAGPDVLLPHRLERDADGAVVARTPLLDCASVSRPAQDPGPGTVTVTTLDPAAGDPVVDADAVMTDGELVYASTDRLYVATTDGGWRWADQERDDISTALHGFDVSEPGSTGYVASGSVQGWLLGRWALSERDGLLRVATTRGERWAGDPQAAPDTDSAVTVLAERDGALEVVGEVGGLGVGEQVRAVRWFDDLAVVVTFRQTDPLYLVDLTDPTAPVVRGELKIPGYSAYLHPVGGDLLLGVGQDATPDGRTVGAQVASYDVSDLTDPRQVEVLVERGTFSEVEHDSRVFSYLPQARVALVPLSGPDGSSVRSVSVAEDGGLTESGRWSPPGGEGPTPGDPGTTAWLLRTVPVDTGRVVAVWQGTDGPGATVLSVADLRALGSADLG
ncbi:beta-propeller domain-containing protein [Thalassiella azotivora]